MSYISINAEAEGRGVRHFILKIKCHSRRGRRPRCKSSRQPVCYIAVCCAHPYSVFVTGNILVSTISVATIVFPTTPCTGYCCFHNSNSQTLAQPDTRPSRAYPKYHGQEVTTLSFLCFETTRIFPETPEISQFNTGSPSSSIIE